MTDDEFRRILEWFNLSWSGYRKVRRGVKTRLAEHLRQLGCQGVECYLKALQRSPELVESARALLSVTISRFFRDRGLWRDLLSHALPEIAAKGPETVKVWSAGCSCGEEAYSMAILWDQFVASRSGVLPLEIWATDNNPEALARAQAGVYEVSSLKELDQDALERYFSRIGGAFAISEGLRKHVHWMRLDILNDDAPARDFHLVFLRNNLLTYYKAPEREPTLEKVLGTLVYGGFLIIGSHERVPASVRKLLPCEWNKLVFRKGRGDGP
jgi:chemotaxis methyl-accepting protein methylase